MRNNHDAFTLIELLVVVAIIAVLLALIAPALDKAVYQAQLAVCAANQKGIGSGVTVYASEYKRHYPLRQTNQTYNNIAYRLDNGRDDRPRLGAYFAINHQFNDPLSGKVDLEGNQPLSQILSSYDLYFGGPSLPGEQAMTKVGDRWTWTSTDYGAPKPFESTVLAGDTDVIFPGTSFFANHPDKEGVLLNMILQDQAHPQGAGGNAAGPIPFNAFVLARWEIFGGWRGTVDSQHVYEDTSVDRQTDVRFDEWLRADRVVLGPWYRSGASAARIQAPLH